MVEVSTGKPPYGSVPHHDEKLALAMCNGLRPRVAKGIPQCYIDLVNQCLDANPEKRPSAKELNDIIESWLLKNKEFVDADKITSQESSSEMATNPEAIYTKQVAYNLITELPDTQSCLCKICWLLCIPKHKPSRLMSFTNLSKAINSTRVQIEDPEVPDSQLIELHVSDNFQSLLDQDLIEGMDGIDLSKSE